ncbi:ABC-type Mn2+/Zn2+ transport system, permease component [Mycobacterium sp. JS623]|uniref:metal ABC transporter permease n=1 Tax=Mycobacterium sp. JS623 TaxID=212767 RepID=UPI0002A5A643|nr:metal ABC transporter permease [Mycobacterium sp. JS623]AGB22413.1 ABC-type Mn2+/Zn2+ transport system, permease component [Mycobacterium sp. JS623]
MTTTATTASEPLSGLAHMLAHPFIAHALLAGTAVAVLCGMIGYFLVLRGQVFAGDALGHVAYTGAMAALAAGFDPLLGLFAATVGTGLALGYGGRRGADDVAIGSFFAWMLGLGVLFLTYYTTHGSTRNGAANVNVLFGSIFGLSAAATTTTVAASAVVVVALLAMARPLLFTTIDPTIAQAAGVPTRLLGALFLAATGATVAVATPAIGALLVLGLLAAPGAAAARLTSRPWRGFWLAATVSAVSVWIGISVAYAIPKAPASFTIITTAAALYALATLASRTTRRHPVSP